MVLTLSFSLLTNFAFVPSKNNLAFGPFGDILKTMIFSTWNMIMASPGPIILIPLYLYQTREQLDKFNIIKLRLGIQENINCSPQKEKNILEKLLDIREKKLELKVA
jgi:hypothetical protein